MGLDEGLDGSGWVWVVNQSRRGELGLEPYGSRLGWVARDKAREWGEVGSSSSVGCLLEFEMELGMGC